MLRAIGVGAKRALPSAAALNWVLKDGLGRLGKLTYTASLGRTFDSDLKVCLNTPPASGALSTLFEGMPKIWQSVTSPVTL